MSQQTKRQVLVGILYRWMHPTVNPYSCGVDGCSLVCRWDGRHPFAKGNTTRFRLEGKKNLWSKGEASSLPGASLPRDRSRRSIYQILNVVLEHEKSLVESRVYVAS